MLTMIAVVVDIKQGGWLKQQTLTKVVSRASNIRLYLTSNSVLWPVGTTIAVQIKEVKTP